jgi:hypothetical protein
MNAIGVAMEPHLRQLSLFWWPRSLTHAVSAPPRALGFVANGNGRLTGDAGRLPWGLVDFLSVTVAFLVTWALGAERRYQQTEPVNWRKRRIWP